MKIPPRAIATVEVDINTSSVDKIKMVPDNFSLANQPNMYMIPLYVDLSQRKKGDRIPYSIVNLSNEENLCLPQDFVVGFAEKDNNRGEVFESSIMTRKLKSMLQIAGTGFHQTRRHKRQVGRVGMSQKSQKASIPRLTCINYLRQVPTSSNHLLK